MTAYYNEHDAFAAAWCRNLIAAGHIAPGDVDERSIEDVCPDELAGYVQCHFFAGIGVWSHALRLAGWEDNREVWTGSCPCQPFSAAGKGAGFDDERHLWPAFHWLIGECGPKRVFGEQVKNGDWLDLAQADLEALDYTFGCVPMAACGFGAPIISDRLYWVAASEWDEQSWQESCRGETGRVGWKQQSIPWDTSWPAALAKFRMLDDGHPRCVGGTDAFRNAIVAPVAQGFIEAVMKCVP